MILAVVYGLTFWEFPFLPRQLSAIDGFTIGIPAFLLAFLPNSQRYQPGFLKRALLLCVPAGVITAIAVISLSAMVRTDSAWSQAQAQTATAILLSITGLWVLSSIDRPLTRVKLLILFSMMVLAVGMFTLPITTEFFGFSYLNLEQLAIVGGIGLLASLFIELASFIIKSRSKPQ
jgi:cation-transporting ATPase E